MEMTEFNFCEDYDFGVCDVGEFNMDELKNSSEKVADLLSKKLIPLYKVIESLNVVEGDLIEKSDAFRSLSAILEKLSPSCCSEKEINLLLRFLLPRYTEHYVYASPVLHCILHILNFNQVSKSDRQFAWQKLLKDSQIQTMGQADRYLYFSSLYMHLWKYLDIFPPSTLSHLIYSIEGERDPEVLFVAFLCLQIVVHPLKKFEESFFEAISPFCPITYRSAEHDKISASDLRSALTYTLCSSEYYVKSAVPLLLEEENVLEAATGLLIYPSGPDMCPNLISRITTGLLLDDCDLACKLLGRLSSSICASSHLVFQPFVDAILNSPCALKPMASILSSASYTLADVLLNALLPKFIQNNFIDGIVCLLENCPCKEPTISAISQKRDELFELKSCPSVGAALLRFHIFDADEIVSIVDAVKSSELYHKAIDNLICSNNDDTKKKIPLKSDKELLPHYWHAGYSDLETPVEVLTKIDSIFRAKALSYVDDFDVITGLCEKFANESTHDSAILSQLTQSLVLIGHPLWEVFVKMIIESNGSLADVYKSPSCCCVKEIPIKRQKSLLHIFQEISLHQYKKLPDFLNSVPISIYGSHIFKYVDDILNNLESEKTAVDVVSLLNKMYKADRTLLYKIDCKKCVTSLLRFARESELVLLRLMSVEFLLKLSELPSNVILPYRKEVLTGLSSCLSDRKRLVRMFAGAARNAWFILTTRFE